MFFLFCNYLFRLYAVHFLSNHAHLALIQKSIHLTSTEILFMLAGGLVKVSLCMFTLNGLVFLGRLLIVFD